MVYAPRLVGAYMSSSDARGGSAGPGVVARHSETKGTMSREPWEFFRSKSTSSGRVVELDIERV